MKKKKKKKNRNLCGIKYNNVLIKLSFKIEKTNN